MAKTYIDCRIAMYRDEAMRIIAIYDSQNDNLAISTILPYQAPEDPFKGKTAQQVEALTAMLKNTVIVIDNVQAFKKWDMRFIEQDHLDEAVRAYYALERSHALILDKDIRSKYNPEQIIEQRKMDLRGNVYELNTEEVNNGNMAVLIACWACVKVKQTAAITATETEPSQNSIDSFSVPFSF